MIATGRLILTCTGAALLQGCGGGVVDLTGADLSDGAIVAVATTGVGANGQAFARPGDGAALLEGETVAVRMARTRRSQDDGSLTVFVTDEVVILPEGWFTGPGIGSSLTLDGEGFLIATSPGDVSDRIVENDQAFMALENGTRVELRVSAAGTPDVAQENAFYVMGTETDPATISALTSTARYDGTLNVVGYAQIGDGAFSNRTSLMTGDMTVDIDFDNQTLSGGVDSGTLILAVGDADFFGTFDASFDGAAIVQNGFEADLVLSGCGEFTPCAAGDNKIGGLFYGGDAEVVAGLVTVDQTFGDEETDFPIRLLGAGAFDGAVVPAIPVPDDPDD